MRRVGFPGYSGRFWFAVLSEHDDEVCALLRWKPTPQSKRSVAVVLADKSQVGNGNRYTYIDSGGLYFLTAGAFTDVVPSGSNMLISGSTTNQSWDAFYGIASQTFTFELATGPSSGWPTTTLNWAHKTCANMLASN